MCEKHGAILAPTPDKDTLDFVVSLRWERAIYK